SIFLADWFNHSLKVLINRPRPSRELVEVLQRFDQISFPSGHVVHYVVFFGFLFAVMLANSRINLFTRVLVSIICIFLIMGVSVSRIYLGAHWATDVIGGYIMGF